MSTAASVPQSSQARCIHHILQVWAELTPDAVAVAAPGRAPLTYGRLFAHVKSMTEALNAAGIGRNDRVIVVLPNGPEMAIAVLAAAAAATCAPLNPAYRANEFDFYLSELKAGALIAQSAGDTAATAVAQRHSIPIIEFSAGEQAGTIALQGERQRSVRQAGSADAQDAALILPTSGTTSRPKMVALTHANLIASARNVAATLQLTPDDRCLNVMPLFHIHGLVAGLLSSFVAGASVALPPSVDGGRFFDWMDELRPTWYTAAPAMHQAVLSRAKDRLEAVRRGRLRLIRSSSAALPVKLMQELEERFGAPVIEAYGMTEAAHQIASNPLPPGKRKPGSVGVAAGPEVAIMNETGDRLPAGQVGEIAIRGANVIQSYDNAAEIDREAFADGWFRTGDQGYLDDEGYLFITGRLKEIVNRGGEKISPQEVDEALLSHPEIVRAAAFAWPHPTLGEELAAAVVVRDRTRTTEAQIREYLAGRLAEFKIPSRVLIVDEIPQSAAGKIRRLGLAEALAPPPADQRVAPKDDLEAAVAKIYAAVLGVETVGASDNFFALGGDSLSATQVLSRIRATFGVNLSIATIFSKWTVEDLAHEIRRAMDSTEPI